MYEENAKPLPPGDAMTLFDQDFKDIAKFGEPLLPLSPSHVVQMANRAIQEPFSSICRRLLLPGSSIVGWENLRELGRLSNAGKSCLLCMSHASNLDVPNLYTILADQYDTSLFHQIIWIAGRKLTEDSQLTQILIQSCNRIVVTPPSWFEAEHTDEEVRLAHKLNREAQRAMLKMRYEGWIFGLFPTGTRIRPAIESTSHAIPESDTYIKSFENLVVGRIDGCTLPVSRDRDYMHETPKRARVVYTFGSVLRADEWRAEAQRRFPALEQRMATAHALDESMARNLGTEN